MLQPACIRGPMQQHNRAHVLYCSRQQQQHCSQKVQVALVEPPRSINDKGVHTNTFWCLSLVYSLHTVVHYTMCYSFVLIALHTVLQCPCCITAAVRMGLT
jgi:hypothetical protein